MLNRPHRANHEQSREERHTVIPAPRTDALFPGWGIKF